MKLHVDNLKKPSNKKFKLIADMILYTLPLYLGAIMSLPLSDNTKLWINFIVTIVTITIKTISKFTTDETINTNT